MNSESTMLGHGSPCSRIKTISEVKGPEGDCRGGIMHKITKVFRIWHHFESKTMQILCASLKDKLRARVLSFSKAIHSKREESPVVGLCTHLEPIQQISICS